MPSSPFAAAPFLSLPDADEVFWVDVADEMRLPVYRLAGPPGGPAILFGHANGMAAGSYAPWLRALAVDATVFAFDSRGHGGAQGPCEPIETLFGVDRIADDLGRMSRAVLDRIEGAPLLYAGHSLNAAAALTLAANGRAPAWDEVVLFEPPIFPAPGAPAHRIGVEKQSRIIDAAARRRPDWSSPEAFFARLVGRGPFANFDPAMLRAHCEATLRPKQGGGFTLCCSPAVETHLYQATRDADVWPRLVDVPMPVHLVSGDPALPDHDWVTGVAADMARLLPNATLDAVGATGHMMICERPEACRALLLPWLKAMRRHAQTA
jgi:pimeloyl-ACP methyl ester carboxylesterase